jgi:hypothetical protein
LANRRWPPLTIADYYRAAIEDLKKKIESTPDDQVFGMDLDQWVDYLVETHAMSEIELDESRQPGMVEVEIEHKLPGYDIYSDRGLGQTVRSTRVRVEVPVVPSDTLQETWKHGLAPNQYSAVTYPQYDYNHLGGTIHTVTAPEPNAVRNTIDKIKAAVQQYNASIQNENRNVRSNVLPIVQSKQLAVREKHSKLDSLAAAVGIPLVKKADRRERGQYEGRQNNGREDVRQTCGHWSRTVTAVSLSKRRLFPINTKASGTSHTSRPLTIATVVSARRVTSSWKSSAIDFLWRGAYSRRDSYVGTNRLEEDVMLPVAVSRVIRSRRHRRALLAVLSALAVASCAHQPLPDSYNPPGFFMGLVHGFLILFSFIGSLFTDVRVYAFPNSGRWYDFGYLIGAAIFLGGGGASSSKGASDP